jgi:hypothetical protein
MESAEGAYLFLAIDSILKWVNVHKHSKIAFFVHPFILDRNI